MTWSIIARDADGAFGVAVASKFFAVGAICPHGEGGVGALSTQALPNPLWGYRGMRLSRAMMDQVMVAHYTHRLPMQPPFTTRPDIRGTFGAIATTHWLATQPGMAVLEQGGNAFDAAVAAGFVLQIVEPHLNGPGGELPAIVFRAGAQTPEVICGQGPFPAA